MAISAEQLSMVRLFINDETIPYKYSDSEINTIFDSALTNVYTTTAHILMAEVLRYTLPTKPTTPTLGSLPTLPTMPVAPTAPSFLSAHDLSAYNAQLAVHRAETNWERENYQAQLSEHRLSNEWEREKYQANMSIYRSEVDLLRMEIDLKQRLIQQWLDTAQGVV